VGLLSLLLSWLWLEFRPPFSPLPLRASLTLKSLPPPTPPPAACRDQLAKVPNDVITDPTLERTKVSCKKCPNTTAVMIIPPVGPSDELMKLILVCTNPECVHKWIIPEGGKKKAGP